MNKQSQALSMLTMSHGTKLGLFMGALYLCFGIILGAFAAHGLKDILDDYQMGVLQTGVKYQLIHGVALLVLGMLYTLYQKRLFYIAIIFIVVGVFLFSFLCTRSLFSVCLGLE